MEESAQERTKEEEAIRRLMFDTNKIDGAYYLFSKRFGVNENTLALLYALDDGMPHSQKQICEDWLIPKTTVNTNVKELAAAGYVMLFPEQGTREKIIGLTPKGKEYASRILKSVYEAERAAIKKTKQAFSLEFVDAMDFFANSLCRELEKRMPEEKMDRKDFL